MFKDYFSQHSNEYSHARPTYPAELFSYLLTLVKHRDLAWDCATGNGQAAVELASYFKTVIATDGSEQQIATAEKKENIQYRVAVAEHSGLEDSSVDLITVAQALHWFSFDAFFAEAKRVMKADGIIAVWCYSLFYTNNDSFNELINTFYTTIVGKFWPPERKYLDEQYQTIPFDFIEIKPTPSFNIINDWSLQQIIAYLYTWSAVQQYQKALNDDPVASWLLPRLDKCIKDENELLHVTMPVFMRVGKKPRGD